VVTGKSQVTLSDTDHYPGVRPSRHL